jgi:hypothetical protein
VETCSFVSGGDEVGTECCNFESDSVTLLHFGRKQVKKIKKKAKIKEKEKIISTSD